MSPSIVIPERELKKVKARLGVYGKLPPSVESELKQYVTQLVWRAFNDYCKARRAPDDMIRLEWNRFNKFLQKVL